MSLETLARAGAIVSSAGVALMVIFVVTLLAFPVIKNCGESEKCSYQSTAPGELQSMVQPELSRNFSHYHFVRGADSKI